MNKSTAKAILKGISENGKLNKADRLQILKLLDTTELTNKELAKGLGISERTLRRNREELQKSYKADFQDFNIPVALYREYIGIKSQMEKAIRKIKEPGSKALALKRKADFVNQYLNFLFDLQSANLLENIEKLKTRIDQDRPK